MSNPSDPLAVTKSSGNVFADLDLPNPQELQAKARLASTICDLIAGRRMTQSVAADLLGTTQPNVSALKNGRLDGFSFERLSRFLNALDHDVEIVVRRRPRARRKGGIHVTIA